MPTEDLPSSKQTPEKEGKDFEPVLPAAPSSNPADASARPGSIVAAATFSGPVPPPNMLKAYDEIEPGLAREIIEWSRSEATHRRLIEKEESAAAVQIALKEAEARREEMQRGYSEARLGQFFAFGIGVFALGCATYLGVHDAQTTACVVGGGGLVAIVTAFLTGRKFAPVDERKEIGSPGKTDGENAK